MSELDGRPTMCDHCGEVTLSLTIWPQEIIDTCRCWCHIRRSEKRDSGKKKKKK